MRPPERSRRAASAHPSSRAPWGTCGPVSARARRRASVSGVSSDAVARLPSVTAPTSAGVPVPLVVLAALAVAGALSGAVALVREGRSAGDRHRATDDLTT